MKSSVCLSFLTCQWGNYFTGDWRYHYNDPWNVLSYAGKESGSVHMYQRKGEKSRLGLSELVMLLLCQQTRGDKRKEKEERSKEYIKLKSKQGKLKRQGGSCTGPVLGCIHLDFPARAKISVINNQKPQGNPFVGTSCPS